MRVSASSIWSWRRKVRCYPPLQWRAASGRWPCCASTPMLTQERMQTGALLAELRAAGHRVDRVELGGGLGVAYTPADIVPTFADYGAMVRQVTNGWEVELTFEPGRSIVAAAGVLLTKVIWAKPGSPRPFIIVDAAMNDLARPPCITHTIASKRSSHARAAPSRTSPARSVKPATHLASIGR